MHSTSLMSCLSAWLFGCILVFGAFANTRQEQKLSVSAISPVSGSVHGGTKVTVTGTGFEKGVVLSFGYVPATGGYAQAKDIRLVNDDTITAVTPAYPQGNLDVIVTNPSGASAALTGAFEFK